MGQGSGDLSTYKKPSAASWASPELANAMLKDRNSLFGLPIKPPPELAKMMEKLGVFRPSLSSKDYKAASRILSNNVLASLGSYRDQFGLIRSRATIPVQKQKAAKQKKRRGPKGFDDNSIADLIQSEFIKTRQPPTKIARNFICLTTGISSVAILQRLVKKHRLKYGVARPRRQGGKISREAGIKIETAKLKSKR